MELGLTEHFKSYLQNCFVVPNIDNKKCISSGFADLIDLKSSSSKVAFHMSLYLDSPVIISLSIAEKYKKREDLAVMGLKVTVSKFKSKKLSDRLNLIVWGVTVVNYPDYIQTKAWALLM